MLDEKNNIIDVSLFETYLAKYFFEHVDIFKPLIHKIHTHIEHVIEANKENRQFHRTLFSVFSICASQGCSFTDFESLKRTESIIELDTFLKFFTEHALAVPEIVIPQPELDTKSIPSLSTLARLSLFKSPSKGQKQLQITMRPKDLFSEANRGTIELEDVEECASRNFGILSEKDTPDELKDLLRFDNYPSRQIYSPKESSLMAQWLRKHHLPVISGISGGIGKTMSKLASFIDFSPSEYQLVGIMIASSTIALGHHSFFEVMRPLTFLTGPLHEQDDLLSFYEQVIPKEVKTLESYQKHIKESHGARLIAKFDFKSTDTPLKTPEM